MKRILCLCSLLFVAAQVYAIDGLPLMKLDVAARPAGMAGAFTAMSGDPATAMYNPAGIASQDEFKATFGHVEYWENIHLESGFISLNLSPKSFLNFHIRYAADNDLEARNLTPSSEPENLFSANTVSFTGTYAMQLSPKVSAGIGLGWYHDKIESWNGSAFYGNAGVQVAATDRIRLGASALNVGPSYHLGKPGEVSSRDISQPLMFRVGGSYSYDRYLGAVDVVVADDDATVHVGAEATVHQALAIRGGYVFNHDTRSFTAGTTISWRNLGLSYAIAPYREDLGLTHLFSLTVNM